METEEHKAKENSPDNVVQCVETIEDEVGESDFSKINIDIAPEVSNTTSKENVLESAQIKSSIISSENRADSETIASMEVDKVSENDVVRGDTLEVSELPDKVSETTDEKMECDDVENTVGEKGSKVVESSSVIESSSNVPITDNIESAVEETETILSVVESHSESDASKNDKNNESPPSEIQKILNSDSPVPKITLKLSTNIFEAPKDNIATQIAKTLKTGEKASKTDAGAIDNSFGDSPEIILFDHEISSTEKSSTESEARRILKPRLKSNLLVRTLSKDNSNDSNSNPENLTDFVDASINANDDAPEIMENDPIAESKIVDMDGESILPEEINRDEKITITHCHDNEPKDCRTCRKELNPKYIGQRDLLTVFFCDDDCLNKFKRENPESFVEKILRLRSFAAHDSKILSVPKTTVAEKMPDVDVLEPEILISSDPQRKCGNCKEMINIDDYLSWEAVDFCHEGCLLMYQKTISSDCAKCKQPVTAKVTGKYCVRFGNKIKQFCNTSCLLNYKKVFKFCTYCQEDLKLVKSDWPNFCSRQCMEMCHTDRKIAEKSGCGVCHKFKAIEIKFKLSDKTICFCGDPCFVAYKFVNKVTPIKCGACVTYFDILHPITNMIFVEGEKHLFCSENCQKIYLITNRRIVLCCNCSVKKYNFDMVKLCENNKDVAYACSNNCLQVYFDKIIDKEMITSEATQKQLEAIAKVSDYMIDEIHLSDVITMNVQDTISPIHRIILTKPRPTVKQRNVATMCKPNVLTKSVTCKPRDVVSATQTGKVSNHMYVPIPVPIFVPTPVHMYVDRVPMPVPIVLPLPVPIFIPTNRKSISGIGKEILKIKNKVPADPLEAELLMMAEMAAGPKKQESSSESEVEEEVGKAEESFQSEEAMDDANTSFGEDVLTMALKMASDFEEPVDLEGVVVPAAIAHQSETLDTSGRIEHIINVKPKRGRKPGRKSAQQQQEVVIPQVAANTTEDKPDANLNLKFTFGVNAWKQWVTMKNAELSKASRRPKLFKPEILQLTSDDLNFSLCLFVKEVRKPNGTEYAPDTIYYLCLGIQQFLYENGRIDNIFCDPFYEKFTDMFNEVCQKFANLYDESQYIVTRVEEEHLWESKQLGAHSPLVLLNTLMFFNTKHFSLTSVDEHLQLSFSHIMKHWKRNPHQPGARNVLLRFYPPQNAESRKKKVYEQQENDENPLRCPVKLYEFFLSKCPESVKTRNDVFYLQPERSCVPDSPVWYSTMALDREPLEKMLNRVKMVKEINVALLTS